MEQLNVINSENHVNNQRKRSRRAPVKLPVPKIRDLINPDTFVGAFQIKPSENRMYIEVGENFSTEIPMNRAMQRTLKNYLKTIDMERKKSNEDPEIILGHQLVNMNETELRVYAAKEGLNKEERKVLKVCQQVLGGVLVFFVKWKGKFSK